MAMGEQPRDELAKELGEATELLTRRLRIALLCWLAALAVFALADLFIAPPQVLARLFALKLIDAAITTVGYFALRAPRDWRTARAIALLMAAATYTLSTASTILDGDVRTIPITSLAVALASATLLPWGVGPQLIVVSLAVLSTTVGTYVVTGGLANLVTYANVGVLVGLVVSIWVAAELARGRRILAAHNREQQRAETAVRRLNHELERRVMERTADLERANRALQKQIAERQRAEQAARQHQAELTHVLRLSTMGEMAAGLAHEINQPLAAIVNYAHGCNRRLRANPTDVDAVMPVIDDIAAEALRAGEIIRRLRSLVRKETPYQDWIDLAEVAGDILRLIEPDATQHGVTTRLDAEPDLPCVLADRIQIEQVILNLLRNAIDAMADVPGQRDLFVAIVRAGAAAVEISVRDSGHGMAAADMDRIFEPFFSTKPTGLGMGLSISRTIIEIHQGRLSVAANADRGVTFRVTLPVSVAERTAAAAAG
jgi:C4-dicarboxylate-specific signal transduction histidine kinase